MPCYLFTFHAYRSWMPDRRQGYVKPKRGILPPDSNMADRYRRAAKYDPVIFDPDQQCLIIETILEACAVLQCQACFVSAEPTHVHVLVSWRPDRPWLRIRSSLKSALTRTLNGRYSRRPWFSENASRKRVRDRRHFNYLVNDYLPAHRGLKWKSQ